MILVKRQIWADSLKGILILLVVLGHAIQGVLSETADSNHIYNFLYSFHMPAFFAISGFFVKPYVGGGKLLIVKRIWQLLVPYFAWALLKLIVYADFSLEAIANIVINPVSFWFLWVLFWVFLIFLISQYLHSITHTKFNYASIFVALLLIAVMAVLNVKLFAFHLIAYYFVFYAMGYYMSNYKVFRINNNYLLTALFIIWFFLAWGWSMHGMPSWMYLIPIIPESLLQLGYRFVTAFVMIVVVMNVAPHLLSRDNRVNNIVSRLGFYSLGIYVSHYLIIWKLAERLYPEILGSNIALAIGAIFIIALILSLVMVWALSKNKYTARLFLGKIA